VPEILRSRKDAEDLFETLRRHKAVLGYVPSTVLEDVSRQVRKGREAARIRFFQLLGEDPELTKAFWEAWETQGDV